MIRNMDLESVGDLAIHLILENLKPEDIASISCVSNRFKSFTSDDSIWSKICFHELSLTQPIDHLGNPLPSFKEAYRTWREAFVMYPWSLVKRVKRCWDNIETWLTNNFPEAKLTLGEGASEAEIQELEDVLNVKLPLPTRILYRLHNGQEIEKLDVDTSTDAFGTSLGIIGGYSFYDHLVNVYLLPISHVIEETQQITNNLGFLRRSKYVLVAASSTYSEKLFFLNCTNGQLYVGTKELLNNRDMMPCVPRNLISLDYELNNEKIQDGMLLWLEEHGRRLQRGFIKLIEDGRAKSINLFPEEPPLCSTAVTNGVQVGEYILPLMLALFALFIWARKAWHVILYSSLKFDHVLPLISYQSSQTYCIEYRTVDDFCSSAFHGIFQFTILLSFSHDHWIL